MIPAGRRALRRDCEARSVGSAPGGVVCRPREAGGEGLAARAERMVSNAAGTSVDAGRCAAEAAPRLPAGGGLPAPADPDLSRLQRTLRAGRPPRELRQMLESGICRGMGGSYSLKMPEVSSAMLARKLRMIAATGAAGAAMDCPGCLMQIRGGCAAADAPVRVHHTAEWLAAVLDGLD